MLSDDVREQYAVDTFLQLALELIEHEKYNKAKSCIRRARERLGFKKFMEDLSSTSMCPIEELEDIMVQF